jgi:hypothetical protein
MDRADSVVSESYMINVIQTVHYKGNTIVSQSGISSDGENSTSGTTLVACGKILSDDKRSKPEVNPNMCTVITTAAHDRVNEYLGSHRKIETTRARERWEAKERLQRATYSDVMDEQ